MPKTLTRNCLSAKDQAVLNSVFNPLQIGGDIPNIFDPEISHELKDNKEEETIENVESKRLELEAIKIAENGDLITALKLFENSIKIAPNRPSPYNNRAQTYRLKGNDDDAFADLDKAIELSSSQSERTQCQAYCQRGVLYRKRENLDAARQDFEAAAKLGSKFAKTQLVEINPYAALCNQMLRDAFEKLS